MRIETIATNNYDRMRFRFLRSIAILTGVLILLLAYPVYAWLPDKLTVILAAWAIAFVNILLGLVIVELTYKKANGVFMASFFGGMAVRVGMTLIVYAILLSLDYDAMVLTFFLMGFYFAYMILEIRFLIKVLSAHRGYRSPAPRRTRR